MALKKDIRQEDGIVTSYHRILFIQKTTNSHNSIAVFSYPDKQTRDDEKAFEIIGPYRKSTTYELPYDADMTIEDAYSYLKTLPLFEGAEDII